MTQAQAHPPDVIVLGGGSAGWITAALLHKQWGPRGAKVTVVESPDIGIIGVGEGSTPQLRALFDHLGIPEAEWMAACDATYKLGIRFTGWSEREGFESYFHPFPGPVDLHTEPAFFTNCALARRGFDVPAHPDRFYLAHKLAEQGRGPHAAGNFPFAPSYGYHFDAYKLGAFLRDWCTARGLVHREAKVAGVKRAEDGDISALLCEDGERIAGDIFVDCSGFRALICQQELGVAFQPYSENLFNDSAVVMPTAHDGAFKPQTEAIAMSAGWRWAIPLTTRTGNGYVYSSRHITDEAAEAELREALGPEAEGVEARFLKMKVGRVAETWHRNCLAAGLAQGFIEPLEATALHIVIATAMDFMQALEQGGFTARHRDTFNRHTAERYEGIRDYIVGHYRLNQRTDSAYWRENATNDSLPDGLKTMMTAWFTHRDIAETLATTFRQSAYPAMSWHALFAGYGAFPPAEKLQTLPPGHSAADLDALERMLCVCAANFAHYPANSPDTRP